MTGRRRSPCARQLGGRGRRALRKRSLFGSSAAAGSMARSGRAPAALVTRTGSPAGRAARARHRLRSRERQRGRSSRTRSPISSCTSSRGPLLDRWISRSASCSAPSASSATRSPGRARPRTPAARRWTSAAMRSPVPRSSRSRSDRSPPRSAMAPCARRAESCASPASSPSVVETAEQLLDQRHLEAAVARAAAVAREGRRASASRQRRTSRCRGSGSGRSSRSSSTRSSSSSRDESIREVSGNVAPSAERPAARRRRSRAGRRADRDAVRPVASAASSHTKLEDTKKEHLELSVEALDRLTSKTMGAAVMIDRTCSATSTSAATSRRTARSATLAGRRADPHPHRRPAARPARRARRRSSSARTATTS